MKYRLCKRSGILLVVLLVLAFGLSPRPGLAASYVPLDCAKASTAADATICRTYALGQDEARLATLFGVLTSLVAMGQRGDIIDRQHQWLSVREACGSDVACLSRAYRSRIDELSQSLDALAKRGPF
ncbi:MAG TPA: hypothetical protein VHB49_20070 [Bradyrhizobium sp.]|nr:hypothetical protein [Bradyrhizobium sp.]